MGQEGPTATTLREDEIMRLLIDTDGVQFRVAGQAKAKADYKDKERQATTRDGEPIWTVRLDAIEPDREARETIWVEVAGEQPRLTFDGYAVVHELVFAPWVGRDGKIKRAFRAGVWPGIEDADGPGVGGADDGEWQRPAGGCGGALWSVRCRWWSARCRC